MATVFLPFLFRKQIKVESHYTIIITLRALYHHHPFTHSFINWRTTKKVLWNVSFWSFILSWTQHLLPSSSIIISNSQHESFHSFYSLFLTTTSGTYFSPPSASGPKQNKKQKAIKGGVANMKERCWRYSLKILIYCLSNTNSTSSSMASKGSVYLPT